MNLNLSESSILTGYLNLTCEAQLSNPGDVENLGNDIVQTRDSLLLQGHSLSKEKRVLYEQRVQEMTGNCYQKINEMKQLKFSPEMIIKKAKEAKEFLQRHPFPDHLKK